MHTILVTGGGRGIGRAVALALASADALVAIAGRGAASLESAAAELESQGAAALSLVMDVADEASVRAGLERLAARSPRIDVLVNNAGISGGGRIERSDTAAWRRIVDTNLLGTYLVSRYAVPLMGSGGRIINVSSVLGRFGVAGYTAYCASKHGVIGFTRALALELADRGITVNAVCPGWVDTEMARQGMTRAGGALGIGYEGFRQRALEAVPIKRIIQPEEVAGLVRFLASPAASAITGQTYNICGGQTMD